MIYTIVGKPGDGKTMFAVMRLLRDLVETESFIVTNIPVVISRVNEYVSKERERKGIEAPFAIDDRLKVIPDSEVYEFYRHRSGGLVLPWSPDRQAADDGTKRLDRPEFVRLMKENFAKILENKEYQKPCRYYIDEAHNFFSARDWATNGRGTLYYASQHRHLHDEVFLITQILDNVEKQLRGLVSETYSVRNYLRRRVGPFKCRPVFKARLFYGVPSEGAQKTPFDVITFALDPHRVGACYKTTGALGIHSDPEKINNKGLPWWLLYVTGGALVLGLGGLFVGLPYLGSNAAKAVIGAPASPASSAQPGTSPAQGEPPPLPLDAPRPAQRVEIESYSVEGSRVVVELSDGSVYDENSPELQQVGRDYVIIDGRKIRWRARPVAQAALPPPPPAPVPVGLSSLASLAPAPLVPSAPPADS